MSIEKTLRRLTLCVLLSLAASVHADSLLMPVPTPDMSKLAPDKAKQIAAQRADLDKLKNSAVGPPLAQIFADMGALYARNGFYDAAAVAFYDASQISPTDSRWYYVRGVIARRLNRNEDAKTNFMIALDHDKIYLPIRYRLADTLIDLNDLAGARKLLDDTAHDNPTQPVVFAMLGQLALKQKRYGDAVANINQAIKLDPKANELYSHLADAYTGQGNAKAADEARAKAGPVTTSLDDPLVAGMLSNSPPTPSGTAIEQAQAFARQGRIDAARDKLAEILDKNPNDMEALTMSARLNGATGNSYIARAQIDQAIKAKPDSAMAYLSSGMVAEYAGDDQRAYEDYQQAQRLDRTLPDSWLLLGNSEMRRGRFGPAADQYRQLVALQPDTAEAYAHLVAAMVAQGKCGDALQLINGALVKRGNNGDLMQLFVRLASTCPAASAKERDTALDYGQSLYKQLPNADNSSALALALAAHGKFKEAQEYQAEAIFTAVRARDNAAAAAYKSTTQEFFAKQKVPDRPWAASDPYFKAPMLLGQRLIVQPPAPAAPAAAAPTKR
jgi:tetratricopeptide (TPR) repeat protein